METSAGGKQHYPRWFLLPAVGFSLIFATTQAYFYLLLVQSFTENPATAGGIIIVRQIPSFFMGGFVGWAMDYGETKTLTVGGVAALACFAFTLPEMWASFTVGLILAWAETTVAAVSASGEKRDVLSIAVGFSYDVAKIVAPFLTLGLWFHNTIAVPVASFACLTGVYLLSRGVRTRGSVREAKWVPPRRAGFLSAVVFISAAGSTQFLWVQGYYSVGVAGVFVAALCVAVGAFVANGWLLW